MDTKQIGQFLSELRKSRNLTQEQLGEMLGVTNKTVSRWENGNYLPPADMLQKLSSLYDVSINEILSGNILDETEYRNKAEENLADVIKAVEFSGRDRLNACGEWLCRYWWVLLICLFPACCLYYLIPGMRGDVAEAVMLAGSILVTGILFVCNHLTFFVCKKAFAVTKFPSEYNPVRFIRMAWLAVLFLIAFIVIDLGLALLYALTPIGTADGYAIGTMLYDILVPDGGDYLMNCYDTLEHWLWRMLQVIAINIDLAILWINK